MNRVIIIGASSGIGKELALLYAGRGDRVGITGRKAGLLEEVKGRFPDKIRTSCFDVTSRDSFSKLESLIAELGGLDLFIYNAGVGFPSETLDPAGEMATTNTNVTAFVALASPVFLLFMKKGGGQLAVTSSVAALRGNSWTPAYSASKAFLSNYAEGLNIKAKKLGVSIVVTDIRPGFVDTKMAKGNKRFWVSSPQKAALQIQQAIDKKKRVAYISRRWWLVGQLVKVIPYRLYRRFA